MTADGRASAWANAWSRLEAMDDIKKRAVTNLDDPLPQVYWGLAMEAELFSRLASAPDLVGFTAGDWLDHKAREQNDVLERREAFKDRMAERRDPSCTCEFDTSQCPIHNQGDEPEDDDDR